MLEHAPVVAFAATVDADRSRRFYRDVLGLQLRNEDQFALAFDAAGTELRIQKVERIVPHPYTALGWRVKDIAVAVAGLVRRGVTFERYPGLAQDGAGVWRAPGGTGVAWFKDPDGNLLSLSDGGPNA
jgi:catechol 2,3-dioxygenase-like lactoylglutathione lyase family enzyme